MSRSAAAFRLFGFPVHVRSGFLLFSVLIVLVNGTDLGLWLAGWMAAFTLLHELGHAFAARATGARAEISLDFMAGYAAFVPTRTLSRWERAGISFAGPAVQIAVGTAVYLAVHGSFTWPNADDHLQIAVLWAGPAIGLFNLIPILPFDGGNILEQAISAFAPTRARTIMMVFTIALVAGAIGLTFVYDGMRPYIVFMIFPLLSVAQMATAGKTASNRASTEQTAARAEALAWVTGDVTAFPAGQLPSPWFRAHQQLQQGRPDIAREVLLADFADTRPPSWWPPDAAPLRALADVVALLPRPLPQGQPFRMFVLSEMLLRLGEFHDAGHYAAGAYGHHRTALLALHVSRAAAALGDRPTALAWLRTAATTAPPDALRFAVSSATEFDGLRHDPEFAAAVSG
ncbi:MAG: hypothetical protein Q7V88_04510 [Actinomycetota bacterium]|nr:hypothetical protein [Actinomycetota bacterium]